MILAVTLSLCVTGAFDVPVPDDPSAGCTCARAQLENRWCASCKVGWIAGLKITSRLLHEALDAHGHDVNRNSLECSDCRAFYDSDGYCEDHFLGFHGRKAYTSRLTFLLARGKAKDVTKLECAECRKHSRSHGWCEKCRIGWVGNVAFPKQELMKAAAKQYELLVAAVKTLPRCEFCAIALFMSSRCPKCRIIYKDGKPVSGTGKSG